MLETESEKARGLWGEFKTFIGDGNAFDMAVGVVIGVALSAIIESLVNDIIMPLVSVLCGGIDFSGLSWKVGEATVAYGSFIGAVVNFLIIAICLFACTKAMLNLRHKMNPDVNTHLSKGETELAVLQDIRAELKKQNESRESE